METEKPETNQPALQLKHISELDSLRGIAILLVFSFHAMPVIGYSVHSDIPFVKHVHDFFLSFILSGNTGVTLFFLLSSFLLSIPFFRSVKTGTRVSTRNFYARRILRIMPLYTIIIMCGIIATGNLHAGLKAMFILWGLHGNELEPFSNVLWSLNAEMQFYLILPLIGFLYRSKSRVPIFAGSFILYCVIHLLVITHIIPVRSIPVFLKLLHSLLGRGYIFIIGIITAWLYTNYYDRIIEFIRTNKWIRHSGDIIFIMIIIAQGLLLTKISSIYYWDAETIYYYWHIAEALLWNLIILLFLFIPFKLKPFVSNKFLMLIGKWSYSIYLIHHAVIAYGSRLIPKYLNLPVGTSNLASIPAFLLIFGISTGLSVITYNFIEKPFLTIKDKLH